MINGFKLILTKYNERKLLSRATHKQLVISLADKNLAPFFIVSSGRSGTTLLRRMLLANGQVHIPPESDDLIPCGAKYFVCNNALQWGALVENIMEIFKKLPAFRFWDIELSNVIDQLKNLPESDRSYAKILEMVYKFHGYEMGNDVQKWGDKTPYLMYQLPWLRLIFPSAKYIHMVRDGRAVVHSMMRKQNYSLEEASTRWKDSVQLFQNHTANINSENYIEVRYEDLVQNTHHKLGQLCTFLNIEFKQEMLSDIPSNMGDTELPHLSNVSRSLTNEFMNQWRNDLSFLEVNYLNLKLQKGLALYRYS